MIEQTTLFGTDQPDDLQLGIAQRAVVHAARVNDLPLTAAEIGSIVHQLRGKHRADEFCGFCGVDGRDVALRLVARGVLVHAPEGEYALSHDARVSKPTDDRDGPDVFPSGY